MNKHKVKHHRNSDTEPSRGKALRFGRAGRCEPVLLWYGSVTIRTRVSFQYINILYLSRARRLHPRELRTKHWFVLSLSMQHLFGIPIMKLRLNRWRRCRGQLPGGPAGDGETPVVSATCLKNLSDHPWRPSGSSRVNLLLQDSLWYSVS